MSDESVIDDRFQALQATGGLLDDTHQLSFSGQGAAIAATRSAVAGTVEEKKTTVSHDAHPFVKVEIAPDDQPGARGSGGSNLASFLSKKLKSDVDYLPLGKPAVKGSRFVVGTEAEDEKQHFIICCDADRMQQSSRADPILHYLAVPEPVRDIQWLGRDRLITASSTGKILMFTVSGAGEMKLAGEPVASHGDALRELAANQLDSNRFASGGHDQYVRVYDVERRTEVDKVKLNGVVGSVKWPEFNQNVCLSATIDDGFYFVFDVRSPFDAKSPALTSALEQKGLLTHCRYSDHYVVFGFDNGDIKHLDMRKPSKILHKFRDPYCDGIGYIEFTSNGENFVAGGYTDFTVWRNDQKTQTLRVWSHSTPSTAPIETTTFTTYAPTFLNDNLLLAATSEGSVLMHKQDWNPPE